MSGRFIPTLYAFQSLCLEDSSPAKTCEQANARVQVRSSADHHAYRRSGARVNAFLHVLAAHLARLIIIPRRATAPGRVTPSEDSAHGASVQAEVELRVIAARVDALGGLHLAHLGHEHFPGHPPVLRIGINGRRRKVRAPLGQCTTALQPLYLGSVYHSPIFFGALSSLPPWIGRAA